MEYLPFIIFLLYELEMILIMILFLKNTTGNILFLYFFLLNVKTEIV